MTFRKPEQDAASLLPKRWLRSPQGCLCLEYVNPSPGSQASKDPRGIRLKLAMCPEPLLCEQIVTLPTGALSGAALHFLSIGEALPFQNFELCKEPSL